MDLDFIGSQVDHSLFNYQHRDVLIYILIYVDDLLIIGSSDSFISSLIAKLHTELALKDLGLLTFFLGIQVLWDSHGLHLRQSKYILDVLHRAKMLGAKPYTAPCVVGGKLSSTSGDPLEDITEYCQIMGALQYCTLTHPKITYFVNQLCQHLHSPTTIHRSSAKCVLCYLKGTIDQGLYYTHGSLDLRAFIDSNWASNSDDRRSTIEYGVFLGPYLVSWCAKKQSVLCSCHDHH